MTESINWSLNAQVIGGTKVMASDIIEIEAYDKIKVTIENDAIEKAVEIQPNEEGKVQFLVIKSEKYGEELTYKVNETSSTNVIKLDALHVFIGTGAVGLLGETPKELLFKNELTDSVSIEILVGRMAT